YAPRPVSPTSLLLPLQHILRRYQIEMDKKTKNDVHDHLSRLLEDAMERVSERDESDGGHNPFRSRLINDAYLEAAKFERSFVTSMGSRGYEQLGRIIAEGAGHTATRSRIT